MTTRDQSGASGQRPFQLGPWLVIAIVGSAVAFVNATSNILEAARDHERLSWWEPVAWEGTSVIVLVAMAPFIGWAINRWPPRGDNFVLPALIQFGLTIPFALVHILAIWISREAIYAAAGRVYGFFHGGVAITMLYEWRKDVLVYAAMAATYWVFLVRAEQAAQKTPASPERIEVRDGGAAVFLDPQEISRVEAAGNYVEFHTGGRMRLVRGTLAAWEEKLAPLGFVRAHRSRIVNKRRIRAIRPTPSGDLVLTLDDGGEIAASRRYRAGLEAATTS